MRELPCLRSSSQRFPACFELFVRFPRRIVSKNGEAVVVGELVELVDSIDVTFSASKNGEAMSDRELISIV